MHYLRIITVGVALRFACVPTAAATNIDAMRWHRRILLVVSPIAQDSKTEQQREVLSQWKRQAADRDVTLVEILGSKVLGSSATAASLRQKYQISSDAFEVLLIGKDGHVALRSSNPISAGALQATIDSMPMRKAGER